MFPTSKLGPLTTKVGSGATPRGGASVYTEDGVAFIRSQNVLDFRMKLDDVAHMTDDAAHALRGATVEPDDVLLNITGDSIARCCVVDVEALPARVSQHVAIVRTTKDLHSKFLQYALLEPAFKRHLIAISDGGGTRKALTKVMIEGLEIPLPSFAEQQAIADVLGALDDKIAANTTATSLINALLAAKFSRLSAGRGHLRLRSIADVNQRSTKPRPGGTLRYLDISSVGEGRYDFPEESPWADAPSRARRLIANGDVVWSTVRPNRRSHALILETDDTLVGSTGLAVLTPREGRTAGLYEATRTDQFVTYLETVAEGSAYPAVRADRFLEAPVPDLDDQEWDTFEASALPMRQLVHAMAVESRRLAATRDELLPLLMSGKIRVKDAKKSVEEVL